MSYQLAALSFDLVGNQASIALQDQSHDGQYAAVSLTFAFADGHYSKRQLLEKAKRLMDEASAFLKAEIARSP